MLNDPQAAQYALLVMYAEDMYDALPDGRGNKNNLTPPIDQRVSANWTIVGFITAIDALADAQDIGLGTRFYYGFLAYSNTDNTKYVAVIRGTANASEWIEDVEFVPELAPANMAGTVENGFFSIYASMLYSPIGSAAGQPIVAGIASAVGSNQLTVLGHSLGSSLATYLTLDLTVSVNSKIPCLLAYLLRHMQEIIPSPSSLTKTWPVTKSIITATTSCRAFPSTFPLCLVTPRCPRLKNLLRKMPMQPFKTHLAETITRSAMRP